MTTTTCRWMIVALAFVTAAGAAELMIEAADFDTGNVLVSLTGEQYADGPSCIWNGGELPNRADYVITLPAAADVKLSALYAALEPRPVDVLVDGNKVQTGFSGITGNWYTKSAKWEPQGVLRMEAGTHTLTLSRNGPFPHICALRLEWAAPFPDGKTVSRLTPEQRAKGKRPKAPAQSLRTLNPDAVRLAFDDMERTFPGRFDGAKYRKALDAVKRLSADTSPAAVAQLEAARAELRAALLSNPLLDGARILVVKRDFRGNAARTVGSGESAGFVGANYFSHASMANRTGWQNEVALLTDIRSGTPALTTVYKPPATRLLRDLRLEFDAKKMLFSSIDANGRWAIYEIPSEGGEAVQVTPPDYKDLDFFDACYLPDGRIIVASTANYQGVPCLSGNEKVSSLYLLDRKTRKLRQLTFDQDHDNDPVVLNDGRVLYQRWEYSDIPHYFSRRRFAMNPDGTGQLALYGSGSWFPTAFRFARPVPDHPSLLAGIIAGHHDYSECGRMALLDPGLAGSYPFRFRPASKEWGGAGAHMALTPDILPPEKCGFVQLVPGYGKPVAGTVCDNIIAGHYLKERPELMTHPHPLSRNYYLVSMKPQAGNSLWGIYLVDVFDNMTLLAEMEGSALFEPVLLKPRKRPPVIPDRVDLAKKTATLHIGDVYAGGGLKGVPRGTVKGLRIFAYHFGHYRKAMFEFVGTQGPWDGRRILGTTPVEEDGSAECVIPANTPVSIQPVDAEGRAVQLMRSWVVGMPGERVSCGGCHEKRAETLPQQRTLASRRGAKPLQPWYGTPRPFEFEFEVYPVLQKFCVGCHAEPARVGPKSKPSFATPDSAYDTLHPYVHRPGPEADMAMFNPMEYHASTSPLIRLLAKGHHGVVLQNLPQEARERLYCWIDLNAPKRGTFDLPAGDKHIAARRCELNALFAGTAVDPDGERRALAEARAKEPAPAFLPPPKEPEVQPDNLRAETTAVSEGEVKVLDLAKGVKLRLRRIPGGVFIMGSPGGAPDERPRAKVEIKKPYWMAETETSNAQYALFDPDHDTRYIDMHYMDRVTPGYIANHPDQPVARVSWQEAMAYCAWLGRATGLKASLPSEAQWEWAARAGTETPFYYGTLETDFGRFANLADASLRWFRMDYPGPGNLQPRLPYPENNNFPLRDERFKDKYHVVDYVGQNEPNAFGLLDMVGNVSEWTRSDYAPYPYAEGAANSLVPDRRKTARGGSWADRPVDAGSSVRYAYESWQKVYNVGFRVIIEEP
ncbi:MAG: SUMF1/EgtB/PvdO family nonheme iron enzyme [bacterium]